MAWWEHRDWKDDLEKFNEKQKQARKESIEILVCILIGITSPGIFYILTTFLAFLLLRKC